MQSPPPFKFCPACGQKLAVHMQQCGRCKSLQPPMQASSPATSPPVTPIPVAPTIQVTTPLTQQQSKAVGGKVLGGCAGILLLLFIVGLFAPQRPSDAEAWVIATGYVRNSLKSPSSADFPLMASSTSHNENIYYVRSYVDAQNSFGATIRSLWTCKIEYVSHLNWRLEGLSIDGQVIVADQQEEQRQAEHNRQEDIHVSQEINHMETGSLSPAHPFGEQPSASYPVSPGRASLPASFPTAASTPASSFQTPASPSQHSVTYMPAPPPNQTLTPIYHNIPPLPGTGQNMQGFGAGVPAGFGARPMGVPQGFGQPGRGQGSFSGGFSAGGGRGF